MSMKPGVTVRPVASMVPPRRLAREVAHRSDAVAGDPQIRAHGRRASPIDDLTTNDLQIKHRGQMISDGNNHRPLLSRSSSWC